MQVSEFTEEQDLRDIFSRFGHVTRVFLAKDRETGRAKGFAFVSFADRDDAKTACEKVDGCKYLCAEDRDMDVLTRSRRFRPSHSARRVCEEVYLNCGISGRVHSLWRWLFLSVDEGTFQKLRTVVVYMLRKYHDEFLAELLTQCPHSRECGIGGIMNERLASMKTPFNVLKIHWLWSEQCNANSQCRFHVVVFSKGGAYCEGVWRGMRCASCCSAGLANYRRYSRPKRAGDSTATAHARFMMLCR